MLHEFRVPIFAVQFNQQQLLWFDIVLYYIIFGLQPKIYVNNTTCIYERYNTMNVMLLLCCYDYGVSKITMRLPTVFRSLLVVTVWIPISIIAGILCKAELVIFVELFQTSWNPLGNIYVFMKYLDMTIEVNFRGRFNSLK